MRLYIHVLIIPALAAVLLVCARPRAEAISATTAADKSTIGMGGSVTVTTTLRPEGTSPREGYRAIPFVDGKRWGAIEITSASGEATHHLPLPNPGVATIQVLIQERTSRGPEPSWIWGPAVPEDAPQHADAGKRQDKPQHSRVPAVKDE